MLLVPDTQIGDSWLDGIKKMFKFYLMNKVIFAQLASLFIINFTWIISGFVILAILIMSLDYIKSLMHKYKKKTVSNNSHELLYFYLLIILFCYFLTRIPFVNNPRYMLPVLPILVILFGESLLKVFKKQSLIKITLTIFLVLLTFSSFRTIDPVSKKIFGTFKFGSHEMLQMARFDLPGYEYGYGRDQLVYNFQFTQFHYISEKILNRKKWAATYVTAPNATWVNDLTSFDIISGKRAIHGKHVYTFPIKLPYEILNDSQRPKEFYYISYPHFDRDNINEIKRSQLSSSYDIKDIISIENGGYSIDLYHFVNKKQR